MRIRRMTTRPRRQQPAEEVNQPDRGRGCSEIGHVETSALFEYDGLRVAPLAIGRFTPGPVPQQLLQQDVFVGVKVRKAVRVGCDLTALPTA